MQQKRKNFSTLKGAFWGAFTGLTVAAFSYLGQVLAGLPVIPFNLFDWLARNLPGSLVTFAIDSMVRIITGFDLGPTSQVAKAAEQALAMLIFMVLGAIFGGLLTRAGSSSPENLSWYGVVSGLVFFLVEALILLILGFPAAGPLLSLIWAGLILTGWGALLGRLIRITVIEPQDERDTGLSRRQFLYLVGAGSFTVLATALGVSLLGDEEVEIEALDPAQLLGTGNTAGPAESPPAEALEARFDPVPGTRPELTPNDDFYRIDINLTPPNVNAENWRLELSGLVDQPLSLSLEDLLSRPAVSQVITLSCISNTVGGDLISTSLWTGVPLKDLLEEAGLQPGAREISIEAADGFYESVPLEEALDERTLLVYAMNDEPLPVEHGFPLRIFIPDHYGMKQPKWITRMVVIDRAGAGYWVDRGWSEEAIPKTVSVVDAIQTEAVESGLDQVPVGGIAYAGARGISRVEVQVDEGPWEEAELRSPPLSPLTWVQWRYLWRPQMGRHTLRVRAYDGTGELQPEERSEPHPDGASGLHTREAFIPNDS